MAKALVYTQAEHRIDAADIDPDALRIVERLRDGGHECYIVGGAVRDLLLGKKPKDFDIVTDAQPPRIRRIFRSSRVIGRRFRLVHVYAGTKIFEVATFRSIASGTVGNEYGTIDEDVLRRDFTFNALYFDPIDSTLIDYVGGFKDVAARRVKPVIPLKTIFVDDPVRMLRCVKYAAASGFRIPWLLSRAIRRHSDLLGDASPSRLTEEFMKILASGRSAAIVAGLERFGLLRHILPETARLSAADPAYRAALGTALRDLDEHASSPDLDKRLALLLAHFLKPFLETRPEELVDTPESYREAVHESRRFLSPLNPPRVELEAAVLVVFKRRGLSPLQRPRKPGPDRPRQTASRSQAEKLAEAKPDAPDEVERVRKRRRRRRGGGGTTTGPDSSMAGAPPSDLAGAVGDATPGPGDRPESEAGSGPEAAKRRRKRRRRRPPSADRGEGTPPPEA